MINLSKKLKKTKIIIISTRNCFLCYYFSFEEWTIEQVKQCAENWMNAENCSNWTPIDISILKLRKIKLNG